MNASKKEKLAFYKFIWSCKAVNPELSKIPQGAMLPSLTYSIIGLLLGSASDLMQISVSQEFMITFFLLYIIFLLLQVLTSSFYISAKGVLRKYFVGDILNLFSTFGIFIFFFSYLWIIIFQVTDVLYIALISIIYGIMIVILYLQSFKPLIKTKGILNRLYKQCKEFGSFPDCKTCKMLAG